MTFNESLNQLKEFVGNRNGMLLSVCGRGYNEGMTGEQIAEAFAKADTGDPPLTSDEINRAIVRAREYFSGEANANPTRFKVLMGNMAKMREAASPDEQGFVRRMIACGESMSGDGRPIAKLLSMSNVPRGTSIACRREMANKFLKSVYGTDELILAIDHVRAERKRSVLYTPRRLAQWLHDAADRLVNEEKNTIDDWSSKKADIHNANPYVLHGRDYRKRDVPTHVGVNPHSGVEASPTKTSKKSFANKATVKAYKRMLVEFDALPLDKQAAFWIGVLTTESFDVLSIVHTGNKSLHGIIRIREQTNGDDLFGDVSPVAARQQYDREAVRIMRLTCSDDDLEYRADASAIKDPVRMTRFPGGLRDGGLPQCLVYVKE